MQFTIHGRLAGLNDYTKACRTNKFAGSKMKKDMEELVSLSLIGTKPVKTPVKLVFNWYEQNQKRDLDNVAFAKKFILDALVKNGILENDNWKCVQGFADKFYIDKENPRVEVEIYEIGG